MRKVLLILMVFGFTFGRSTIARSEDKHIHIELNDGGSIRFTLDQDPVIKYGTSTVTVTYSTGSLEYKMKDIRYLSLGNKVASSVATNEVAKKEESITSKYGTFLFNGFAIGTRVAIYDLSGKMLVSYKINDTNTFQISTSDLKHGTYIIKAGSVTYKFIK